MSTTLHCPYRIQRKRTKGWRMPVGAVYVGRPTKWGNPFTLAEDIAIEPKAARMWAVRWSGVTLVRYDTRVLAAADAVDRYRRNLRVHNYSLDWIMVLRGHDLACWCPLDQPCHADVLLELANQE